MGGQSDTQHAQGIPEYIRTYRNITINPAQQSLDPVYIIYILVYELFAPITTSLLWRITHADVVVKMSLTLSFTVSNVHAV